VRQRSGQQDHRIEMPVEGGTQLVRLPSPQRVSEPRAVERICHGC
jgi:hypothetical protein